MSLEEVLWVCELRFSKLKCCSMAGKQVYEVPSDNVGGSSSCIAVCIRGMDIQKVSDVCFAHFVSSRDLIAIVLIYLNCGEARDFTVCPTATYFCKNGNLGH